MFQLVFFAFRYLSIHLWEQSGSKPFAPAHQVTEDNSKMPHRALFLQAE